MSAAGAPPGAQERAQLGAAFGLLQQGRAADALGIARAIIARAPQFPEAWHMLALCCKALGDDAGALQAFDTALAGAPRDPGLLGNYANFLGRVGRNPEAIDLYRRALALAPRHGETWINLGLALHAAGDARGAGEALERAVELLPDSPRAWQGLGAARRAANDLEGAETALRRCLALAPANGAAWINLGVVRRLQGDPAEALDCYREARSSGFTGPELVDAEASAYLDLGDAAQALGLARQLVASAPAYAEGQLMLAHILWEHGAALAPGEDPRAAFRAAVASQPDNRTLGRAFVHFLVDAGAPQEALTQLRAMRAASDEPDLVAREAHVQALLGETAAADRLFAQAWPLLKGQAGFLNLYAAHLLKARRADEAAVRAEEALEGDPANQPALAYLGLAWRLLGDSREDWLCGYERLVAELTVEPPEPFTDEAAFIAALERTLLAMHTARREPVNQSLRGGSQTAGVLFGRRDPIIDATRAALARAVMRYVAALPADAKHPFLRRKAAGIRFTGSWSVRLWSGGRHVNHYHQEGWVSSAYYVSLPPSVTQSQAGDTAGCIGFGQPPAELGLQLEPRRVIRPRVGRLVLFPSYLWHGTLPFVDDEPRLTVAFDAVPVAAQASGIAAG